MAENYYYAASRINALENELITDSIVSRMLDASSAEEAFKYLNETGYKDYLSEVTDVRNFEEIIEKGMVDTYRIVDESTKNPLFTRFLRVKNDYINLKILLKSSFLGEEKDEFLSQYGTVSTAKVKAAVNNNEYNELSSFMQEGVTKAVQEFEITKNPQDIDVCLDKAMYQEMLSLAEAMKDKAVLDSVKAEIDLVNIRMFVRIKRIGGDYNFFKNMFIEGGKIELYYFTRYFGEPIRNFADYIQLTSYGTALSNGLREYSETNSITEFEKVCENYLLNLAKEGKKDTFGSGPILGYLKAKENESKVIRIIMVGKINQIPSSVIRGRLRDLYV